MWQVWMSKSLSTEQCVRLLLHRAGRSNSLNISITSNHVCLTWSAKDSQILLVEMENYMSALNNKNMQFFFFIEHTASKVKEKLGGVRIHTRPGSSGDSLFFTQHKMMVFLVLGVYLFPLTQQHAYWDRGGKTKDLGMQLNNLCGWKEKIKRASKISPFKVQWLHSLVSMNCVIS